MIYIIVALLFYTVGILLVTVASRKADTNMVSGIVNTISAIIPIVVVLSYLKKEAFDSSKPGIIYAILGGIAIALFSMALNKSFATDKVAIVSPVVFGGAIFLTSILSYFLFKEKITTYQGIGLAILGLGLVIIIYAKLSGK
ncbi:MAG TPA: EamA family transporter [Candidatus Nitrosocosmicus sp.]|nr:EamA family transporter [Candidatus Nitrosocosmicus sp.]